MFRPQTLVAVSKSVQSMTPWVKHLAWEIVQ